MNCQRCGAPGAWEITDATVNGHFFEGTVFLCASDFNAFIGGKWTPDSGRWTPARGDTP